MDTFKKKEQAAMAQGHRKSMNVDVVITTWELKLKWKEKNIRNCVHTCTRVRMHFGYVKNKPKCHVSKLEHYVCDKGVVKRALEAAQQDTKSWEPVWPGNGQNLPGSETAETANNGTDRHNNKTFVRKPPAVQLVRLFLELLQSYQCDWSMQSWLGVYRYK